MFNERRLIFNNHGEKPQYHIISVQCEGPLDIPSPSDRPESLGAPVTAIVAYCNGKVMSVRCPGLEVESQRVCINARSSGPFTCHYLEPEDRLKADEEDDEEADGRVDGD